MRAKLAVLALAVCAALLLSGCDALSFGNVNELLRAPELGEEYGQVQQALAAYIKTEPDVRSDPEYKYPREGEYRTPLIMVDLDGDGAEECVAFFTLPDSATSNVYLAVLKQSEGGWAISDVMQGEGAEVASVAMEDMFGTGGLQLIVGYGNATLTSKFLVLYSYSDGALNARSTGGQYDRYLLGDFTGRGGMDLAVVFREEGLSITFFTGRNGFWDYMQSSPSSIDLEKSLTACRGIYASTNSEGERFLVIDGYNEQLDRLSTQILAYAAEQGRFYIREADSAAQITALTETVRKNATALLSRDLFGDGTVLTPVEPEEKDEEYIVESSIDESLSLMFIKWVDFTQPPQDVQDVRSFGLYDSYHGLFVQLPDEWRSGVSLVGGDTVGSWQVLSATGEVKLELLDVLESEPPEGAQFIYGTQNSYILAGEGITAAESWDIRVVVLT